MHHRHSTPELARNNNPKEQSSEREKKRGKRIKNKEKRYFSSHLIPVLLLTPTPPETIPSVNFFPRNKSPPRKDGYA